MRMSVAMAAFNGATYLPDQLASIAAQTAPPAELVVYEDGSSDGTPELVAQFAESAPFPVRVIGEAERAGSSIAFERAISACESDVIVLCDQDDLWSPDKLRRLAEAFTTQPSAVMAFSDGDLVDEDGRHLDRSLWQSFRLRPDRDLFPSLMRRSQIAGCSIAFRSELRDVILPMPESIGGERAWLHHDGWIALVASATGPCVPVAERLVSYRIHPGQQIGTPRLPRDLATAKRRMRRLHGQHDAMLRSRLHTAESLLARLTAAGGVAPDRIKLADEMRRHLEARAHLARARRERLAPVWRELRSGRYGRFSLGAPSALFDLVVAGPAEPA